MSKEKARKKIKGVSLIGERAQKVLMAIAFTIVMGGGYLYWTESQHRSPNFSQLDADIRVAEQKSHALQNVKVLPDIKDQWELATHIAANAGVELEPLEMGSQYSVDLSVVDGGHLWQGLLRGNIKDVLFAAIDMQNKMMVVLGDISFKGENGVMVIGVLGAAPKKLNVRKQRIKVNNNEY